MTKYKLGKGTVLKLLRKQGVKLRAQGLSNPELPEAIRLYKSGWSLQRVGDQFDCSAETVRQALRAAGVVIRGPHDRPRPSSGS